MALTTSFPLLCELNVGWGTGMEHNETQKVRLQALVD